MRTLLLLLAAGSTVGCSGGDDDPTGTPADTDSNPVVGDDDDEPTGQCGEVSTFDMQIHGQVLKEDGTPAASARVYLEDRAWAPNDTILGEGTTDYDGHFAFPVPGVTSVEDCWGTLLDYWVVGELGTAERGERGANPDLYASITDGTLIAELSFPLDLEAL